jgi:hypothetical protein
MGWKLYERPHQLGTKMLKLFSILICILCTQFVHAKILLITHAHNRPEFIEWQYHCFKKFLLDDYEFVVYNDAVSPKVHRSINNVCKKLEITCIPIPQEIHAALYPVTLPKERFWGHPSNRHSDCITYSLQERGFNHDGVVVIIDSDFFLIRPLSIIELMDDHDIMAIMRVSFDSRVPGWPQVVGLEYLWPAFTCLQMNRLPDKQGLDFSPGIYPTFTLDTGGHTLFYLQKHRHLKLKELGLFNTGLDMAYLQVPRELPTEERISQLTNLGFTPKEITFILNRPGNATTEFAVDRHFLHYRGASYEHTGSSQDDIDRKLEWVKNFMHDLVN